MHESRGGRHPLDIAGTDDATPARGVAMLDLAAVGNCDRLEPAVRMGADPAPSFRGRKILWPSVIQQQKRRYFLAEVIVRKNAAHGKPVADPMALVVAADEGKFFHRSISLANICVARAGDLQDGGFACQRSTHAIDFSRARAHAAAPMPHGRSTCCKAACKTLVSAPGFTASTARWRRHARGPAKRWKRPRGWRVIAW